MTTVCSAFPGAPYSISYWPYFFQPYLLQRSCSIGIFGVHFQAGFEQLGDCLGRRGHVQRCVLLVILYVNICKERDTTDISNREEERRCGLEISSMWSLRESGKNTEKKAPQSDSNFPLSRFAHVFSPLISSFSYPYQALHTPREQIERWRRFRQRQRNEEDSLFVDPSSDEKRGRKQQKSITQNEKKKKKLTRCGCPQVVP